MRPQSQGSTHDDVVEDGRTRINEQLATLDCLDNTVEISRVDLLNYDGGFRAEKVTRTNRITVATGDVMPLTSE